MEIYPAIGILGGRAVYLSRGCRESAVDCGDPVEIAKGFVGGGARALHVIDLSGAFSAPSEFNSVLERIAALGVFVQSGGGLRSTETIMRRFAAGAGRVVLGTVAVEDGEIFRTALERYGPRVAVALDTAEGKLMTRGRQFCTGVDAYAFACEVKKMGVEAAVYTEVSRDGMLSGVDRAGFERMQTAGLDLLAAGGVRDLDDIRALKRMGAVGAIVGRAFYTGRFTLKDAIAAAE